MLLGEGRVAGDAPGVQTFPAGCYRAAPVHGLPGISREHQTEGKSTVLTVGYIGAAALPTESSIEKSVFVRYYC